MRFLWSCVLATGLLLVGLELYEGRRAQRTGAEPTGVMATPTALEDGTGAPTPRPRID